jgi:hypothetical protein
LRNIKCEYDFFKNNQYNEIVAALNIKTPSKIVEGKNLGIKDNLRIKDKLICPVFTRQIVVINHPVEIVRADGVFVQYRSAHESADRGVETGVGNEKIVARPAH